VELIEAIVELKEELKEFEKTFERDEYLKIQIIIEKNCVTFSSIFTQVYFYYSIYFLTKIFF